MESVPEPIRGASLGTLAGAPPAVMTRGRTCVIASCPTVLSRFNRGRRCWLHQELVPVPLRAPRELTSR